MPDQRLTGQVGLGDLILAGQPGTSRVRLNTSKLGTFYYEPPHLARQLTTLDVLGDGRLGVGAGLGWMKQEYDLARNADWQRRGKMLDDTLTLLQAWWTTNPVFWNSEFLTMPPVRAGRAAEAVAGSGVDEAYFDAFAMFTSLDQLLDFAAQVIERTGRL
ncbi:LLM class flavin-dependent oxidoreductase [Streptomyces sp. SID5926]|nr:LLM class flavin-dependent oxidoreductase [Streptomyces sp. SID5926]